MREMVEAIIESKKPTVLAITGGGTFAFGKLLSLGGGSQFLKEGIINYAPESTHDLIGGEPDHYSSPEVARKMAVACYDRCVKLGADPVEAHGFASTAKLGLTHREERQGRRHDIHIACHTYDRTYSASLEFSRSRTRAEEEALCSELIVDQMCGWYTGKRYRYQGSLCLSTHPQLSDSEKMAVQILHHADFCAIAQHNETRVYNRRGLSIPLLQVDSKPFVFPGSFNPLHEGHRAIINDAAKQAGKSIWLEMCMSNTDKPTLDYITMHERYNNLQAACINQKNVAGIIITNTPLFMDKARKLPRGATFIMGADTFDRLGNDKYGDPHQTCKFLLAFNNKLLVYPRNGTRLKADNIMRHMTTFVPKHRIEVPDVSSRDIRKANS